MMRNTELLLFAVLLSPLVSATAHAATYPAASCNESDVQAAYKTEQTTPADGDIISIPSGTCTWTTALNVSPANSLTFQGAGAVSATQGGASTTGTDNTIINDDASAWMGVTTISGKSLRITGLAIYKNSGYPCCSNGELTITGPSQSVRVDHNHFVVYTSGARMVLIQGSVLGVADHNVFDGYALMNGVAVENGRTWNGDAAGFGDKSWADSAYWGSNKFFFMEDNYFNNHGSTGGYFNDCSVGGREVIRYNTMNHFGVIQAHEMTGDYHGCREGEIYQNTYLNTTEAGAAVGTRSGTVLVWGNTLQQVKQIATPQQDRVSGANGTLANGYSMCGNGNTSNGFVGIVNTSGTSITWQSGQEQFAVGNWPSESNPHIYINGTQYTVASVQSGTALTLTSSAGTQTGVAYYVPAVWDGNTDTTGYPCFDMPGRGKGDLLTGTFTKGTRVDSVTGTATWPNQAVDPIYVWDNTNAWPGDSADVVVGPEANVFQNNRDYYQQMGQYCYGPAHNSCGENPSGITLSPGQTVPFTGAAGIGQGLYSAIPATCTAGPGGNTPGVGYWAADQNTLYVCNPTNTWTAYYTPYPYPHPLTQNSPPNSPTNLKATAH